jgi:hypothetical protein
MKTIGDLRQGWEEIEQIETRLLQNLTVQESLQQWLSLQETFEAQLQETAALFAGERRAALIELQARLQRLAEWQKQHAKPVSFDPDDPTG